MKKKQKITADKTSPTFSILEMARIQALKPFILVDTAEKIASV